MHQTRENLRNRTRVINSMITDKIIHYADKSPAGIIANPVTQSACCEMITRILPRQNESKENEIVKLSAHVSIIW